MTAPALTARPPAAWRYLLLGAILGLGAPAGYAAVCALPGPAWRKRRFGAIMRQEWRALAYMALATPLVFGAFGYLRGRREKEITTAADDVARMREDLAAIVAHDLRGPLQTVLLQLDLLDKDEVDGEVRVSKAALARLRRNAERLRDLVADLIDVARIEAERLSLSPEPISLADAARKVIEQMRPLLGERQVALTAARALPEVLADPERLQQILANLLDNAVKHGGSGPIAVRVFADSGGVACAVEDHGPGIAAEELPRLFDRFYGARRARDNGGLGLGLYIVKGLVEAHGGQVRADSQVGRGATFTFWLPASPALRTLAAAPA